MKEIKTEEARPTTANVEHKRRGAGWKKETWDCGQSLPPSGTKTIRFLLCTRKITFYIKSAKEIAPIPGDM